MVGRHVPVFLSWLLLTPDCWWYQGLGWSALMSLFSSCWLLRCGLWYVLSLESLSMLCGRLLLVTLTHCALTACHSTLINFTCMRCFALLLLTQCNLYCLHFTYIVMLLHFITFYWISLHTANHWLWHMQPQERQMFSSGFSNSLSIIFNLILKIFN